ncbi:MAG: NAD(P)/FAD-dependent oxidoreductase [Chloroflexi bacterium]|jgi:glycerol-3-phosphate dehydrogenase|nr:NAD(P)/FAD-dependent oxidoreductase [Anaerolineaceae bacterium]NMB86820.1 NAD(P)/FAD-dependent oxidoreductase [Chloroflexota bacterium]
MKTYDLIIIGGGVVGCMTARFLSRYQLEILLIEQGADVGVGASSSNSAIIHAGYDPVCGTLKAEMNVRGNAMWSTLSGELNFDYDRRGDYVVAVGDEEFQVLEHLVEQGRRNGVPGMHIISAEELRMREPDINPAVSGALWAPTGGIADPFMATVAAAENSVQNGVHILLETSFEDFIMDSNRIVGIRTNRGEFRCRWVVNAAGLNSDVVMHKAGVRPEFCITPRRGEYSVLDSSEIRVNNVLFPVPTEKGKGILVTTTTHGNPIVGPNAQVVGDKDDRAVTEAGIKEIWAGAQKLFPSLKPRALISTFAGIRATGNAPCQRPGVKGNDFVIEIPETVQGLVNLGGIESPGLTSSPAIAMRVIEMLQDAGEKLVEKPDWNPIRPPRPRFRRLPREEQIKLINSDPRYGRVVCRCETVTEGEIVAEINAPIPARTYDAIKRRTWLGTGRCQGSFDMPRVVDILSRELGIPPEEVTKKGAGSQYLFRRTKDVEVQP